jgi:hypothetical protein
VTGLTETKQDREELMLLIRGFQLSRMIRLAADLSIPDRITVDGCRDVHDLAADCAVLPRQLLRVLRALAAFGIFRVSEKGIVTHSPRSLLLRSDAANGLHEAARFYTAPGSWKAWGALDEALVGRIPHQVAWGTDRFDYLRDHPDEARLFDAYMAHVPDGRHHAIAAAYDFSGISLIADIGGGNGEALRRILARVPTARGLVFDRPDVIEAIPSTALLDGRIMAEAGSFFDRVPTGADLYLLIRVLHDWSDEDCLRILRTCRQAMRPHSRLLIGEQVLDPDPARGPPVGYLADMQMMAMFGNARERVATEFHELLTASGFTFERLIPTDSLVSIIEAAPR